jgi:hypothetical protein
VACFSTTGIWFIGRFVCGLLMRSGRSRISRNSQVDGIAPLSDRPMPRALSSEEWLKKYTKLRYPTSIFLHLKGKVPAGKICTEITRSSQRKVTVQPL